MSFFEEKNEHEWLFGLSIVTIEGRDAQENVMFYTQNNLWLVKINSKNEQIACVIH